VAAGLTGVWFQRHQTRRCLEYYGPVAARRISAAPVVELLLLEPGPAAGRLAARTRIDASQAPGLVHMRRGLVEDANFSWRGGGNGGMNGYETEGNRATRLPLAAWDVAIVFSDKPFSDKPFSDKPFSDKGLSGKDLSGRAGSPSAAELRDQGRTELVIDFDPSGGSLAVVGQPGRIGLGRIGPGLEKWIRSTLAADESSRR
jgi:hypothetical protein